MVRLRLCFFIFLCTMILPAGQAYADCYWNQYKITAATGNAADAAEKGINYHKYLTTDISNGQSSVFSATIVDDKVIAWFGASLDSPAVINVYSLDGTFMFGHYVQFDIGNGISKLNMYEADVLVYMTAANCVYRFSEEGVQYYYIPPELTNVMLSSSASSKGIKIYSTQDCCIKVLYSDGSIGTIVDHSDEYQPTRWFYLFWIIFGGVSLFFLVFFLHEVWALIRS